MTLAPLLGAPAVIQFHAAFAFAAIGLGVVQFLAPKGTLPHRTIGWAWATLMILVAGTSLFIHTIRTWGPWSPIHLLSLFTLAVVPFAVCAARQHDVRAPSPGDDLDFHPRPGRHRPLHARARAHHEQRGLRQLRRREKGAGPSPLDKRPLWRSPWGPDGCGRPRRKSRGNGRRVQRIVTAGLGAPPCGRGATAPIRRRPKDRSDALHSPHRPHHRDRPVHGEHGRDRDRDLFARDRARPSPGSDRPQARADFLHADARGVYPRVRLGRRQVRRAHRVLHGDRRLHARIDFSAAHRPRSKR